MKNNKPLRKTKIANNAMPFDWKFGKSDSNVILENKKLDVKLLRYIVISDNDEFLYDAFSIRESRNNTVVLVRNQSDEIGLVWEWRPIPEKWFWACPRGFADPDDEDNIATGKREMIEEIGSCKVVGSKKIGELYQNTTFYENPVGLVLLDVEEVETNTSREEGIVDFKFYSKEDLLRMIHENKIEDTFTLSALMKFFALDGSF
jgi:hypothetical protein